VALGINDARLGQHIVVVVTPADGVVLEPQALIRELKTNLPPYMVPKQIVVRHALPRSANGKFDRGLLRQELLMKPTW
jgi:acyl-CoA synthetase (AMP-forming)/AMP-acid ligase II